MPQETQRQQEHYHRSRWTFMLAYKTWLRLSELATVQMGDFWFDQDGLWRLYVHPSKHEKEGRLIDALPGLMDELQAYRKTVGMMPYPIRGERQPAILGISTRTIKVAPVVTELVNIHGKPSGAVRIEAQPDVFKPLGERAIFDILKNLFRATAEASRNPWQRDRLRNASPHWLRHSGITHALNAGMDVRYVSAQARHKDMKTTLKTYDHGMDPDARREQMRRLGELRATMPMTTTTVQMMRQNDRY
jgi:integrase